jgi:hypothetical protein
VQDAAGARESGTDITATGENMPPRLVKLGETDLVPKFPYRHPVTDNCGGNNLLLRSVEYSYLKGQYSQVCTCSSFTDRGNFLIQQPHLQIAHVVIRSFSQSI